MFWFKNAFLRVRPDLNENILNQEKHFEPGKPFWGGFGAKMDKMIQNGPFASQNVIFDMEMTILNQKCFLNQNVFCESGQIWMVKKTFWTKKTFVEPENVFLRVRGSFLNEWKTLFPYSLYLSINLTEINVFCLPLGPFSSGLDLDSIWVAGKPSRWKIGFYGFHILHLECFWCIQIGSRKAIQEIVKSQPVLDFTTCTEFRVPDLDISHFPPRLKVNHVLKQKCSVSWKVFCQSAKCTI